MLMAGRLSAFDEAARGVFFFGLLRLRVLRAFALTSSSYLWELLRAQIFMDSSRAFVFFFERERVSSSSGFRVIECVFCLLLRGVGFAPLFYQWLEYG